MTSSSQTIPLMNAWRAKARIAEKSIHTPSTIQTMFQIEGSMPMAPASPAKNSCTALPNFEKMKPMASIDGAQNLAQRIAQPLEKTFFLHSWRP